jgi:hypothetical protein
MESLWNPRGLGGVRGEFYGSLHSHARILGHSVGAKFRKIR